MHATKLKVYPSNSVHNCCFNPVFENVDGKQHITIQYLELRIKSHFEKSDMNLDDIATITSPENSSWLNQKLPLILNLQNTKNLKQVLF